MDIVERIKAFLQRLEVYTKLQPLTTEMSAIAIQILIEVLLILEITTNEIKRSRMSEQFRWDYCIDRRLTEDQKEL